MTFALLLIAILILFNKTEYTINDSDIFSCIISDSISFLKWGTLKTLVRRAHINCSTEKHIKEELNHIRKTFDEINNYPHWVITKVFK